MGVVFYSSGIFNERKERIYTTVQSVQKKTHNIPHFPITVLFRRRVLYIDFFKKKQERLMTDL